MNLQQTEQAILATLLVDRGAKEIIKPELSSDKFSFGPATDGKQGDAHRKIYQAMSQVSGRIDAVSVANILGEQLEKVGGMAYLQYLSTACLPQFGVRSTESLPQWVIAVDTGGRLRQVGDLVEEYSRLFQDFQTVLEQVQDVEAFVADMQEKLSSIALGGTGIAYQHISDANADYQRRLEDEAAGQVLTYYPMGWPSFDKYALPPQSELMVISGLSGIGKTQLMLQVALGVAIQLKVNDVPGMVAINSYEMAGWRCSRRLAACLAGVDYQSRQLRDNKTDAYRAMIEALEFVSTLPIYYDTCMTMDQISLNCTKMCAKEEGPIVFLGVDYAEEVPGGENEQSEERRVTNIFRGSKRIAIATGCCSCVLSQVSDVAEFRNGIVPYNRLRYSRGATNAAGVIAYVYNPPQMRLMQIPFVFEEKFGDESFAYVLVQKNRDGKVGSFPLEWTPDITRFRDLSLVGFGTEFYQNLSKLGFIDGRYMEDF